LLAALSLPYCSAQTNNVLTVAAPDVVTAKHGAALEVKTRVQLKSGYHANSNTPSEAYLIPMRLTWTPGPLEATDVVFPKAQMEKYDFSPTPLSVFTGDFELVTKFKVAAGASGGPGMMLGKLRYQACNQNSCLAPKTVEVKLPVVIQ
jgi:thiol:disulfide interchange protein DsbD